MSTRRHSWLGWLLSLLLLGACTTPLRIERAIENGEVPSANDGRSAQQVHVDLVRGMLAQKQYYAALAHVQELQRKRIGGDQLRVLEAQARSKIGQTREAESIYQTLLGGRYAGEAYQGLGLLYADSDADKAAAYLRQAVLRLPTNIEMRNDLGYALMMAGRYSEARPELATAVELDPQGTRSGHNLIILLILMRDEAGVRRIAAQSGVKPETLASLRKQAQTLAAKTKSNTAKG